MTGEAITPYTIEISSSVLEDLQARLARTRWPDAVRDSGWEYGTDLEYLQELVAYWQAGFDWRAQERTLNELPHFRTPISDVDVHFVHVRGQGPAPFPLVLTHGWPSTFFELTKLIPLLTDPAAHGADAADAFDVVVPSMPGFGFSSVPRERFVSARVPEMWATLMERLGYERFGAHGGDIGGGVTANLGRQFPQAVAGIHVTNVYGSIGPQDPPPTDAELAHLARDERWRATEWAYGELQQTKPQSLAFALNDSPVGLASWIVEKYRSWSDSGGDIESAFTKDELLTNITIYWATGTIGSSFRPYWDYRHDPDRQTWAPIPVPAGIAVFPHDISTPPREFAERSYDVRRFSEMARGGHFAALEAPDLLAQDIREFFREVR
ncbi:MAG: Epoxide hydrolase domain protein [Conexibacter sp.]|nr:Epoxide hydrolase domain protein [Conexibacter sp.]